MRNGVVLSDHYFVTSGAATLDKKREDNRDHYPNSNQHNDGILIYIHKFTETHYSRMTRLADLS